MRSYTTYRSTNNRGRRTANWLACRRRTPTPLELAEEFRTRSGNAPTGARHTQHFARRLSIHFVPTTGGQIRRRVRTPGRATATLVFGFRIPDARADFSARVLTGTRSASQSLTASYMAIDSHAWSEFCSGPRWVASIRQQLLHPCASIRGQAKWHAKQVSRCPAPRPALRGCARYGSIGRRCKTRGTSGCCSIRRSANAT